MSRVEANLQKFVRRTTNTGSGYTRLCLLQVMTSGGSNTLRDVALNAEFGYDEQRVNELVAELMSVAQEDADGHRGLTTYCLKSFKGVTQGERSPLFRLRSQESEFDDESLGDTEPATKDGHLAQLMRHNEVLMRQNVMMTEVMSNQSTSIISRQTELIKHYEDRHFDNIMKAEELANEKEEREASRLLLTSQEKRKDQVMALLKPLVPIAMAKFKGTPAEAKPELWREAIKHILSDVTPEKMEKLAEILGPHSLALAEIYMDAHREDEKNNEQAGNIPSGTH